MITLSLLAQEKKGLGLDEEEQNCLESLQHWLSKLQRDSSTDDEEMLDEGSRAYLHSFRDNFTRYSLFQVSCLLGLASLSAWHSTCWRFMDLPAISMYLPILCRI